MPASDGPIPAPDSESFGDWRRQYRRHKTNCLTCNLGAVLDLSQSGMRVGAQGRPPLKIGDVADFTLHSPEGDLTVSGRTSWMKRIGLRKYELGIEFIHVRRPMAAALESLGRFGFLGTNRYIRHGEAAPPLPEPGEGGQMARNVENVSQLVGVSLRRLGIRPGRREPNRREDGRAR